MLRRLVSFEIVLVTGVYIFKYINYKKHHNKGKEIQGKKEIYVKRKEKRKRREGNFNPEKIMFTGNNIFRLLVKYTYITKEERMIKNFSLVTFLIPFQSTWE